MNANAFFSGWKPVGLIVGVMLILNIILIFIPMELPIIVEICGIRVFATFLIGCIITSLVEEIARIKETLS